MTAPANTQEVPMANQTHEDTVLQAHYQIEAMCGSMLKAARSNDTETLPYLVQALAIRIGALNGALMNAVNGEIEASKELRFVVNGTNAEVVHG